MNSFAIYRLPYQTQCTAVLQHSHADGTITADTDLDCLTGFAIAPFDACDSCCTVIIRPEEKLHYTTPGEIPSSRISDFDACCAENALACDMPAASRDDYAHDFGKFHAQLSCHDYTKLVLAREKKITMTGPARPMAMFAKACHDYPRLFVALFSSPACGTWLVATPEVLIEREGDSCHTMALAGTMNYEGDMHPRWSQKNICEQACVAAYILDAISPVAKAIDTKGPYTVRAAHLVHLRTDYDFIVDTDTKLTDLIASLHPTPAVCGLPKKQALDFILRTEHTPRGYYSGYCGPVNIDGATHLYVSLRCMRIDRDSYRLYAGGGLLAASDENAEWQETENKMQTMMRCIPQ